MENDPTGQKTGEAGREIPDDKNEGQSPKDPTASQIFCGSGGMTLEQLIDMTGEFGHLHELVMHHIQKEGGFTGEAAYFKTIQPLLDLLEVEIRLRCRQEMTLEQVKGIVKGWIDQEIEECARYPVPPVLEKRGRTKTD